MSKSFSLQPVFGPAVTVRNHSNSLRNRRSSRGWFSSIRNFSVSSTAMSNVAVYGLLVLALTAAVSYIFLINSAAAKGYEMKKIQNRIQEQNEIRHSLEIKVAELASLGAIDQAAESASLVGIKNEEFLTPTPVTALKTSR